jgi:hypothetical protein
MKQLTGQARSSHLVFNAAPSLEVMFILSKYFMACYQLINYIIFSWTASAV